LILPVWRFFFFSIDVCSVEFFRVFCHQSLGRVPPVIFFLLTRLLSFIHHLSCGYIPFAFVGSNSASLRRLSCTGFLFTLWRSTVDRRLEIFPSYCCCPALLFSFFLVALFDLPSWFFYASPLFAFGVFFSVACNSLKIFVLVRQSFGWCLVCLFPPPPLLKLLPQPPLPPLVDPRHRVMFKG